MIAAVSSLQTNLTIALTTASVENAIIIAQNTPAGPRPRRSASAYASGSSQHQKQPRLMNVGVHASPAPLNDCVSTIP